MNLREYSANYFADLYCLLIDFDKTHLTLLANNNKTTCKRSIKAADLQKTWKEKKNMRVYSKSLFNLQDPFWGSNTRDQWAYMYSIRYYINLYYHIIFCNIYGNPRLSSIAPCTITIEMKTRHNCRTESFLGASELWVRIDIEVSPYLRF